MDIALFSANRCQHKIVTFVARIERFQLRNLLPDLSSPSPILPLPSPSLSTSPLFSALICLSENPMVKTNPMNVKAARAMVPQAPVSVMPADLSAARRTESVAVADAVIVAVMAQAGTVMRVIEMGLVKGAVLLGT